MQWFTDFNKICSNIYYCIYQVIKGIFLVLEILIRFILTVTAKKVKKSLWPYRSAVLETLENFPFFLYTSRILWDQLICQLILILTYTLTLNGYQDLIKIVTKHSNCMNFMRFILIFRYSVAVNDSCNIIILKIHTQIHHARSLPLKTNGEEPNTYVKVYLKPDRSKSTKRKTKVVRKNCYPSFMETVSEKFCMLI